MRRGRSACGVERNPRAGPAFLRLQAPSLPRPRLCPVLDSKVKAVVGYEQSIDGYRRWAADSMTIARFLENHSIKNPMGQSAGRVVCRDVDMAVFAELNGWWL